MAAMSIRLPESLHRNARACAAQEGVSVNQLITTAPAEKPAALGAQDYLATCAQRASKAGFERALAQVPDEATAPGDELKLGSGSAARRSIGPLPGRANAAPASVSSA